MRPEEIALRRKREALDHALGSEILEALADREIIEVLANPDGRLVVDRLGVGRREGGAGKKGGCDSGGAEERFHGTIQSFASRIGAVIKPDGACPVS